MDHSSIISGEKFQQLCPVYCGVETDLKRNPIIGSQPERHCYIDKLDSEWNNPSLIFCYSNSLQIFMNKIKYLTNPFILVSHNEDTNITSDYKTILECPLLKYWYAQNLMIEHPKIELLPIGIANSMWPHGNISVLLNVYNSDNRNKTNNFYFYFNIGTNSAARQICKNIIESKGIPFGYPMHHLNYLQALSTYKFAICPIGNGIDCHRTWECYYLGVIPILIENNFTLHLQKYLPCILLKSWHDFNIQCIYQFEGLSAQLKRSQKYLNFSYYKNKILSNI
jgi:hypothetical protein